MYMDWVLTYTRLGNQSVDLHLPGIWRRCLPPSIFIINSINIFVIINIVNIINNINICIHTCQASAAEGCPWIRLSYKQNLTTAKSWEILFSYPIYNPENLICDASVSIWAMFTLLTVVGLLAVCCVQGLLWLKWQLLTYNGGRRGL